MIKKDLNTPLTPQWGGEDEGESEIDRLRARVAELEALVARLLPGAPESEPDLPLADLQAAWNRAHERHCNGGRVSESRVRKALQVLTEEGLDQATAVARLLAAAKQDYPEDVRCPLEFAVSRLGSPVAEPAKPTGKRREFETDPSAPSPLRPRPISQEEHYRAMEQLQRAMKAWE